MQQTTTMTAQRNIEDFFNKYYEFTGNEHWLLPTEAYKAPPWYIETLQQMKIKLNAVKGQLGEFDLDEWSKHTRSRDPSSFIVPTIKTKGKIELLTQAWCKFYECLSQYPIVPGLAIAKHKLTSLHLCEAPGAFVSALNRYLYTHYRRLQWEWHATTLNPCYEANPASDMIADDRLIRHTMNNWDFGEDQTGDLMKYYNHEALTQKYPSVMLVTADGSVDCMKDPGEQESNVHFLHYCETMTALKVLEKEGTFVLKVFTMYEHSTVCLMYLLACCFAKVHVFKPCSSKSGNSEVYVICLAYKGWKVLERLWESLSGPYRGQTGRAMFALAQVNPEFLRQLEECADYFMHLQSHTINENVRHFLGEAHTSCEEIDQLKQDVANHYIKMFPVAFHIPKRCKLIKNFDWRSRVNKPVWDFKTVSTDNLVAADINIQVGKALDEVVASKFSCSTSFQAPPSSVLLQAVRTFLPLRYTLIQGSDFQQGVPQCRFQREFFCALRERLESCCDVVIVGIPLLTRFLVGVVYILALGFESVLVYRKGVLVLHKPDGAKLAVVKSWFDGIDSVFCSFKVEKFVPDILQVVPNEILENGGFFDVICGYNEGICGGCI